MNQPPLNPDALKAAERWMQEKSATFGLHWKNAKPIIETYLAAALPETRCVERHSPDLVCDGCEPPTPALPEVTSVEELEALPEGTILRDSYGLALHKRTANWWVTNCDSNLTSEDLADEIADTAHTYTVLYRPEVKP